MSFTSIGITEQWVFESKDTETFDDHGNSTGYKYEYWENGAWVIQYAMGMTHTYNEDGDITETIFSQWDYGIHVDGEL